MCIDIVDGVCLRRMGVQLAIKFSEADIEILDLLVAQGYAPTRTEVVRAAVGRVVGEARYCLQVAEERAVMEAFPETEAELNRWDATATALCDEEDWSEVYSVVDDEIRVNRGGVIRYSAASAPYGSAA